MSRFVAVSFLFLGWGFYELSGGAEFQPPEPVGPVVAETQPTASSRTKARVTAASLVTRPVLRPAEIAAAQTTSETSQDVALATARIASIIPEGALPAVDPTSDAALAQIAALGASLASGGTLFPSEPLREGVQVASLEGGLTSLAVSAQLLPEPSSPTPFVVTSLDGGPVETGPDLREITASSVNMRGGPGTGYPVIGRMNRGQPVEVLSDPGSGWLRLRNVEKQQVGWIAASLISRKAP